MTLYIPNDTTTKPTMTMTVSSVNSMPDQFSGLYIAGRSKVDVNFSDGAGKYGATITGYKMSVDDVNYDSPYTSGYLLTEGQSIVKGQITDSRGFTRVYTHNITVIAYSPPKIQNVSVDRCDKNGNVSHH